METLNELSELISSAPSKEVVIVDPLILIPDIVGASLPAVPAAPAAPASPAGP